MDRFYDSSKRKPTKKTANGYRVIRRDKDGQRYVITGGEKVLLPTNTYVDTPVGKRVLRPDGTVLINRQKYRVIDGNLIKD